MSTLFDEYPRVLLIRDSSNLKMVGYSEEKKLLLVSFQSGATYRYENVTPGVFSTIAAASSAGAAFNIFVAQNKAIRATKVEEVSV